MSLEPFHFFIGSWKGNGQGHSGTSEVVRTYRLTLGGRYLQVESTSTYPPQERNPRGERHEEVGMISFDKARGVFVFRQFHIEGFINQYHSEMVGSGRIVFVTEAIENIPEGWRARETYLIESPDKFVERFELAAPGKDFDLYSENQLTRRA